MLHSLRSRCALILLTACWGVTLAATVLIAGCADESSVGDYTYDAAASSPESGHDISHATEPVAALVEGEAKPADEHLNKLLAQRKIVYNSDIHLQVVEFEEAVDALRSLVDDHQGFVASHEVDGGAGHRRSGHWKIRVPSVAFDSFHVGLKGLGYPAKDALTSKEVTEEYVDVEHRLATLKRMSERLQKHLDDNSRNLQEIFEVERELTRVAGEMERLQGRLNLLNDLTALATVNLEINEEEIYEPVALVEPPEFVVQLDETFTRSSAGMIQLLQYCSLAFVGVAPWLPILIPVGFLLRYLFRKYHAVTAEGSLQH